MKPEIQDPLAVGSDADTVALATPSTESDTLRQELAAEKDLHLHLAADFENFKRRSRAETDERAAAQKDSFIQELLPIIDNLERALSSGGSAGSQQLHQGVAMMSQQLRLLLAKHGIETAEIVGQRFDPNHHEAIAQRHDPDQPDHVILEVAQRGYRRGAEVFRPAKVVVNDLTLPKQAGHAR
jgi:molecular chaperone GrpE